MQTIVWHLPRPMNHKVLSQGQEKQLFYNFKKGFSAVLNKEITINSGDPIAFGSETPIFIYYEAIGFTMEIFLEEKGYFPDSFADQKLIKIAWFNVNPQNKGIGTKIVQHFLQQVSKTGYEKVYLDTRDEGGQRFWARNGFKPFDKNNFYSDWYLPLPYYKYQKLQKDRKISL